MAASLHPKTSPKVTLGTFLCRVLAWDAVQCAGRLPVVCRRAGVRVRVSVKGEDYI